MTTPEPIRIFIGFDQREAAAYHVCVQSLIEHSSQPLEIHPLALNNMRRFYAERHMDGSNAFIYTRFLVPYLCGWSGYAIFLDGDMLIRSDIAELWDMRRGDRGVHVVKHYYTTKHPIKYLGNKNEDYPRKNWSSVILWNCGYFPNRCLTPAYIKEHDGSHLHRFEWLKDEHIESLPPRWNHLVSEYPVNPNADLLHYTIGTPCFPGYEKQEGGVEWITTFKRMIEPCLNSPQD
jgi:lipopolysaccharide biosynthesis glycosyltransferase